ncbi:PREDICTED: LOW QUALITY PROTEIN: glutaredoxin domain-containing cysteine-rich protein CG31559 [Prunus mume]|uniref:LOW QUALITY PROTEIN: glutaredoxin domain-containing cysteine-rich protein CG31559 n=1 Tax=Prunus mume TaxID=102107 RepID=A0ABM0PG71_PRUMU|nr:PREDICTED: LOW QUALITY PROTEIN: glutaredoxin domain-containing cysteine-rich protein CG31559 [Prunus mume]
MGCASSKRVEAAVDYKPAPASYAVFDINAIQEPWLVFDNTTLQEQQQSHEKPAHVPAQILDKLKSLETEAEAAPHTWDEVSKALENLKPKTDPKCKPEPSPTPSPAQNEQTSSRKPRKSLSFHTLDELDKKLAPKPADMRKSESMRSLCKLNTESTRSESRVDSEATQSTQSAAGYIKPVKENIFIMRDRMEREKEGKLAVYDRLMKSKRDPLSEYPERCPPGGADSGCHRVVYDERDVALHGEFLGELRGLLGEESNNSDGGVGVPRVFVKGRYLGGAEELVELNESGVFGRMVKLAGVERGVGWRACEGCGGARFVPCMECGGSCKVVVGDKRERCPKCNENGLVQCVACWSLT